ncbi:MAG: serine/threonine protein kinase [Bacteroidales bacterium]|nr:serine/threonine protein kinase [Bacteroidales bacterium]
MELIGQTINGYKFIEFIGEGGFGSVYKVFKNSKPFAIKVFREAYVLAEFKKSNDNRITREIDVMQNVKHPFLVDYVEHFMDDLLNVQQVFLVMDFIEGDTLRECLRKNSISDKEKLFLNILEGVKCLHDSNIIHRDLKPENIKVKPNGDIKILDYGLSKLIDYTSITSTGNILGTFAYMSPEQITDSKHIDFRSDLYTLGFIFYELLTGRFPYNATIVPEFIDKIKNEHPTPPRKWNINISNTHENIILKLLEKESYKRFQSINDLIYAIKSNGQSISKVTIDLSKRFIVRTYDDKAVLEDFILNNPENKLFVNFPINHQYRQKGLLQLVQDNENITLMFDPSTIRLAYDTYTDVKGLLKLPYCPADYRVINPSYLSSYNDQKQYVKLVLDEQYNLQADILTSPYHYSHNTNVVPTSKRNPVAEWFDLDIKLLKESIEYRNNTESLCSKPLYAGICINANTLTDLQSQKDLLDTYAAMNCEGYIIYADGINKSSTEPVIYHYIKTLVDLQKYTQKPVIAGRLDTLGLGLLCAGITGFTSGAARFESFYEDLYKEVTEQFKMYERYYFPELLGTIAITKKDPIRLQQIIEVLGQCKCTYCKDKPIPDLISSHNTKLHFLELINREVEKIISTNESDRVNYFLRRIEIAINNYKRIPGVFKPDNYKHLERWQNVFNQINKTSHV